MTAEPDAEEGRGASVSIVVVDPERSVSLAYVSASRRSGIAALWALDETLGGLVRAGRQPIIAQMRLTWWHEALSGLAVGNPPPQPILMALAKAVVAHDVPPADLADMVNGWEVLLDDGPLDDGALLTHAKHRGGQLFACAGSLIGAGAADPLGDAGRGWALVDLGLHLTDRDAARRCFELALPIFERIDAHKWSKRGRPVGMLARLAALDARTGQGIGRRQGSPARLLRMLRHRMTGR